jgi:hypothetical protein
MDAALAWTRHDWKREEAEQQRRLLDLAATRCRGRTTPVKAKKKNVGTTPASILNWFLAENSKDLLVEAQGYMNGSRVT